MSSSDETTVETESPLLIKSRPVPRRESLSESEENDSQPERTADESEEERDDDYEEDDETEKSPLPVIPVAPKPSSAPKTKPAPRNAVKSKTYDQMVLQAMEKLNENRRLGVSIQRILKYVNENNEVPSNRVKLYCKKAIDKGLKENTYVHTTGAGLSGSIAFSVDHWNDLKKEQKKALKAAEREEKSKATAKRKPKPKQKVEPKPTVAKKPKVDSKSKNSQPQKDKNNNPTVDKGAAKKTKKIIRLSVTLPTTKAKPRPKATQGAKTNKEKKGKKGKAVASAKGPGATTRSKPVDE